MNFGGLDARNREQQGIPQPSFSLLLHACASLTKCIPVFVSENTLVDPISAEPGECLRIPDLLDYEIPTKDDSCPHHQPSAKDRRLQKWRPVPSNSLLCDDHRRWEHIDTGVTGP